MSAFSEFIAFLIGKKKWILLPLFFILFALGGLLALTGSSAITPFLYALF